MGFIVFLNTQSVSSHLKQLKEEHFYRLRIEVKTPCLGSMIFSILVEIFLIYYELSNSSRCTNLEEIFENRLSTVHIFLKIFNDVN